MPAGVPPHRCCHAGCSAATFARIDPFDHLVLTTARPEACVEFYSRVLDLCSIASLPLDQVIERPQAAAWPILDGPVLRTGAPQTIRSVDRRDPDFNLVEISELA